MRRLLINESYWTQRVTGQQRYATEIARRLGASTVRPTGFWSTSALRVWAWVQLVLPIVAGSALVLSMTSRAPLWRRRHVLVVHDLFVITNPEWYSRTYVWTHAPLLRAQIRSAAAVVAVSKPVADQVARLRSEPVEVAPNAPSEVFSEPDTYGAALEERGLVAGEYFLAVGSRDPRKNLGRLAEAYGRLSAEDRRRHPLVVVGGAKRDLPGRGDRLARRHRRRRLCDRRRAPPALPRRAVGGVRQPGGGLRAAVGRGCGRRCAQPAHLGHRGVPLDLRRARSYVDPLSTASITDGLRAEIDNPQQQEIDLERFSWDASAAVIRDVCLRAAS